MSSIPIVFISHFLRFIIYCLSHFQLFKYLLQLSYISATINCHMHQKRIDLIKRYFYFIKITTQRMYLCICFKKCFSKSTMNKNTTTETAVNKQCQYRQLIQTSTSEITRNIWQRKKTNHTHMLNLLSYMCVTSYIYIYVSID